MSLARAALLLTHANFHRRVFISPNPNTPIEEYAKPSEKEIAPLINMGIVILRLSYSLVCVLEALVVVAFNLPKFPFSRAVLPILTSPNATCAANLQPNTLFLVGLLFTLHGDLLRLWCFRELGKHFTFVLTIQKDHKLITSGPYAYLRHPSYLGAILGFMGEVLCHLTRGSWFMECAGSGMNGLILAALKGLFLARILTMAPFCVVALKRAGEEDQILKHAFGKEWKEWEERVPYRSIPGIY
ncbi:unnamed protein product [Cyclocybe aegerita]|uniref:Protein-S-isoprenylcysteine O-methyltransferase n=1 Tax=Cyclocybe aegerita TaxID=1973307 RepID=A0A8S0VWL0_CYCAE|nr:unnamed protein product [Cyclocybe aegerita]